MGGLCVEAAGLEVQLHRKLDLTSWVRPVEQTEEASGSREASVNARGANSAAACAGAVLSPPACGNAEDGSVREIDELSVEGQVDGLRNREVLDHAEIRRREARPAQGTTFAVAELTVVSGSDRSGVKVDLSNAAADLHSLQGHIRVDAGNTVGARLIGAGQGRG